jgi:hypothetical protein
MKDKALPDPAGLFSSGDCTYVDTERNAPMPINKLVLLLIVVIAAAGGTILLATSVWGPGSLSENWMIAVPLVLVVYLVVRVIGLRGGGR